MKKEVLRELANMYTRITNERDNLVEVAKNIIANDYTPDGAEAIDNEVDYIINRYEGIKNSLLRIIALDKMYGYDK